MKPTLLTTLAVALLLGPVAAAAAPSGAVVLLEFQREGDRRVVAAGSDQGLVFIGADLAPFRAFRSDALDGREFLWMRDVDDDRNDEYVFAGSPSFVLDGGADPLFGMLDGCDDFFVGNILDDSAEEILCRRGNTISVWYFDGQFLWEYSVTGRRIESCTADDLDSDERLEFGCETSDTWLLIDLGNDDPVQEVPDNPTEGGSDDPNSRYDAEAAAIFGGERTFDINGDGDASETLRFSGNTLTISDGAGALLGTTSISESALYSATVADLDNDGTNELFVGGVGNVYVVSPSGELRATVVARPQSLDRQSRVTVESANANGLAEADEAAVRGVVEGGLSALQRCYDTRMGRDQFVRVGAMLYELSVDGRGRVSGVSKIHSSVRNAELESCIEGALEDLRFSAASGDNATVTVRLGFDFVDR